MRKQCQVVSTTNLLWPRNTNDIDGVTTLPLVLGVEIDKVALVDVDSSVHNSVVGIVVGIWCPVHRRGRSTTAVWRRGAGAPPPYRSG